VQIRQTIFYALVNVARKFRLLFFFEIRDRNDRSESSFGEQILRRLVFYVTELVNQTPKQRLNINPQPMIVQNRTQILMRKLRIPRTPNYGKKIVPRSGRSFKIFCKTFLLFFVADQKRWLFFISKNSFNRMSLEVLLRNN